MNPADPAAGVLLLSFGAVDSPEDVEAYYTNIRHGTRPSPELVADLRRRYERIGGRSPLLSIMRRQAAALEAALEAHGAPVPVRVGMKFWRPTIEDALRELVDVGVGRVVAFTSGPYDSAMSVGSYERVLGAAKERVGADVTIDLVRSFHDRPELERAWRERFDAALSRQGWTPSDCHVLFTAHALPERVLATHDPYPQEFLAHGRALADAWRLPEWGYAYQSAGLTREPWLGPDILAALEHLRDAGVRRVLDVPIGFVADHLEILHDLDVEASARAKELGMGWQRAASLNDSPALIQMLSAIVRERLQAGPLLPTPGVATVLRTP